MTRTKKDYEKLVKELLTLLPTERNVDGNYMITMNTAMENYSKITKLLSSFAEGL